MNWFCGNGHHACYSCVAIVVRQSFKATESSYNSQIKWECRIKCPVCKVQTNFSRAPVLLNIHASEFNKLLPGNDSWQCHFCDQITGPNTHHVTQCDSHLVACDLCKQPTRFMDYVTGKHFKKCRRVHCTMPNCFANVLNIGFTPQEFEAHRSICENQRKLNEFNVYFHCFLKSEHYTRIATDEQHLCHDIRDTAFHISTTVLGCNRQADFDEHLKHAYELRQKLQKRFPIDIDTTHSLMATLASTSSSDKYNQVSNAPILWPDDDEVLTSDYDFSTEDED